MKVFTIAVIYDGEVVDSVQVGTGAAPSEEDETYLDELRESDCRFLEGWAVGQIEKKLKEIG